MTSIHMLIIYVVFQILRENGIKVKAKKCKLFQKQTNYLGRTITDKGYGIDKSNIKAVTDLVTNAPSNIGQLRRVLGLLGYYRRYVKGFSRIAQPLFDILKKDNIKSSSKVLKASTSIHWRRQHQKALETLMTAITLPSLLTYPDFDQPFILHADASTKGLGAGLYQYKDKKVIILGYGSRALAKAEQKCHSSKLEFLSLKWAVCEQFRDYLTYAKQIEVYTDNNPLLYVLSSAKLNATGQRWVNELADFNINIHYKPGRNNTDADALSRFPEDIKEYNKTYTNEVFSAVADGIKTQECCNEAWLCALNTNGNVLKEHEDQVLHQSTQTLKTVNIKKHQDDDQAIKRVKEIILNNEQILAKDKVKEDPAVQSLLRERKKLKVNSNNILLRSTEEIDQIVITPSLK